jgi:hypothetical protein
VPVGVAAEFIIPKSIAVDFGPSDSRCTSPEQKKIRRTGQIIFCGGGVRELRSLQPPYGARMHKRISDLAGLSVQHQMKNDVTFDASIAVRRLFICMLT